MGTSVRILCVWVVCVVSGTLPAQATNDHLAPPSSFANSTEAKRVLVVDSDDKSLTSLTKLLVSAGYEVITARSGEEGLIRLRTQKVNLVIAEVVLPGITGLQMGQRLREDLADIPIILITSMGYPADPRSVYSNVSLLKPLDDSEVLQHAAYLTRKISSGERRPRILIVEDNESSRYILAKILRAAHYEVLEAEDGVEALKTVHAKALDLVITDWLLPRMDGVVLAQTLKKRLPGLPIIVLSAGDEDLKAPDGTFDLRLRKPLEKGRLMGEVARLIERHKLVPASETQRQAQDLIQLAL